MNYSVFDAHCDTLCELLDNGKSIEKNNFHIDRERMNKYNNYTQVFACWIAPEYAECAMERFIRLADVFYRQSTGGILSVEGAEMITSTASLRMLYRMGVRIIALTWNYKNNLASGVLDKGGLTELGAKIIKEMNRLGIFLDVSHLNDQSFYDAVKEVDLPILATHSNSRQICNHPRNLTDDMFLKIKNSGGVCGINFFPPFVKESGKPGIDDIIKHIDHFISLGGEDNIGIGADFDGVDGMLPEGINGCEDLYKVFDRLLQIGYKEEQVEKISHRNFERVLKGRIDNA